MITTHTRKTPYGYTGFVQITDGPMRRSRSTHIVSLTRKDAKANAEWLKQDILLHNKHTGHEQP